jgi:ribosome recycling factor
MGTNKHLEDVAMIATPDDYHFAIYPKIDEKDYIQQIINGILLSHPEFKLSMKKTKIQNEDKQYLEYEMPEVDKNRRDLLNEAVKTLYDEVKVNIEKIYAEEKAALVDLRKVFNDEDIKKTDEELDRNHDLALDQILTLKIQKLDEVEDGYQRYLTMHPDEEAGGSKGLDVTKALKMNEEGY